MMMIEEKEEILKPLDLTNKEDAIKYMKDSANINDWNYRRERLLSILTNMGVSYDYKFTNAITKETYNGTLPFPQWFTCQIDHNGLCPRTLKRARS